MICEYRAWDIRGVGGVADISDLFLALALKVQHRHREHGRLQLPILPDTCIPASRRTAECSAMLSATGHAALSVFSRRQDCAVRNKPVGKPRIPGVRAAFSVDAVCVSTRGY